LAALKANAKLIESLGRVEALGFGSAANSGSTKILVTALEAGANVEFDVPLGDLVNVAEERSRLEKEIEQLAKIVQSQQSKLQNESFVARAPKEVIDKEKLKMAEAQDKLAKSKETLAQLANMKSV
jgi:valyl-tRNA synthetase